MIDAEMILLIARLRDALGRSTKKEHVLLVKKANEWLDKHLPEKDKAND
jgi:hypothetical protein